MTTRYPALEPLSVAVQATPLTIPYKQIGDLSLYIDIYSPTTDADYPVPAVIFFHGGGMTVGDRTSWLPIWLCKRTIAAGFAFISADYRLLAPSTGHDVLEDVIDLFAFLVHTPRLGTVQIDVTRLAVAGSSAGALCAFLSVGHASPKPRAVLSLYCFGGDLMSPYFLSPKTEPFFNGYEVLDPTEFSEFLYPKSSSLAPIAQSLPTCFGPDSPTPGMPSNPRMKVGRMWLQLGVFLDYWTGCHEPSVSATLRALLPEKGDETGPATIDPRLPQALPPSAHTIFPELLVNSEWPPVMLIHGSNDTAVPARNSRAMHARLLDAKVETTLHIVDSARHSFDLNDGAEKAFGELFNEAIDFLRAALDVA